VVAGWRYLGACWRQEAIRAEVSSRAEPLWQRRCWFDAGSQVLHVDYMTSAVDLIRIIPAERVGRRAEIREFASANHRGETFNKGGGQCAVTHFLKTPGPKNERVQWLTWISPGHVRENAENAISIVDSPAPVE